MSRGELTHEELESIAHKLPDLSRVTDLITPLSPGDRGRTSATNQEHLTFIRNRRRARA